MRGFWADERVDGGLWNLRNPLYRAVYNFFKKKERQFLVKAAHTVSLTECGKEEILRWNLPGLSAEQITVIPCCTDTKLFKPITDRSAIEVLRKELNIAPTQTVISYLGSLGTWYMAEEMFDFFKIFLNAHPDALFLMITQDEPQQILALAAARGVSEKSLRIRPAARNEVPYLLSLAQANVFFIKPVYSKKASSPTKMGESLSMGIPVICNDGVGDCSRILANGAAGILIKDFSVDAYEQASRRFTELASLDPLSVREVALQQLSLQQGIQRYQNIYSIIESQFSQS